MNSKAQRFEMYVKGLRKEILQLSHACGYSHPCQFTGKDIETSSGINKFTTLEESLGYAKTTVPYKSMKDLHVQEV